MTDEQLEALNNLQKEVHFGEVAENAYNTYFKDFLNAQTERIFTNFRALPLTDDIAIKNLKLLQTALDTLDLAIRQDIANGKHAQTVIDGYKKDNENG